MRVFVHGVRGSRPAAGCEFVRYGGHTSCLAVSGPDGVPDLVLDAGTGLVRLSDWLAGAAFRGSMLLSHLHWDHFQGLPFFAAGDRPDSEVSLWIPAQGDTVEVLSRAMSPPHFPIGPQGLRGNWSFGGLEAGEHVLGRYEVWAIDLPHKGGRTFGYRISADGRSIAYVPDHAPTVVGPGRDGQGELHPAVMELVEGVDLLFHDAQYTRSELPHRQEFGHASIDYAIALADAAQVGHLVLFHHDPGHDDEFLDTVGAETCRERITVAREGQGFDVGRVQQVPEAIR